MKLTLIILFLTVVLRSVICQTPQFEQLLPTGNNPAMIAEIEDFAENGCLNFLDVDGDNDIDIIQISKRSSNIAKSFIYFNDGMGNYSKSDFTDNSIEYAESIDTLDFDNDGDIDVFVVGRLLGGLVIDVYENDGNGEFVRINGPFTEVLLSSVSIGDVDNDGYKDVFVSGQEPGFPSLYKSRLYINDGIGSFNEDLSYTLRYCADGASSFSDLDGDGDLDLIYSGMDESIVKFSTIYENDGLGNFSERTSVITPLIKSDLNIKDLDQDGDLDVVICGEGGPPGSAEKTVAFRNDGNWIFTEIPNLFPNVEEGNIVIADFNGDLKNDVIISGYPGVTEMYLNQGSWVFTLNVNSDLYPLINGSIVTGDIDNDGDNDILTGGKSVSIIDNTNLYLNNGAGTFYEVIGSPFISLKSGGIFTADLNGDNFPDAYVAGVDEYSQSVYQFYQNDGSGSYIEYEGFTVGTSPVYGLKTECIFADVDGDSDLDFFASSATDTKLYLNDGLGVFSISTNTFDHIYNGSMVFGDIDNDSDIDLIYSGQINTTTRKTVCYKNNGNGVFTFYSNNNLKNVSGGCIRLGDIDGDQDLDLFLSGTELSINKTWLYENDGNGNFTEITGQLFEDMYGSEVQLADIDGDSDLDVFISENVYDLQGNSHFYLNDGLGDFTELNVYVPGAVNEAAVGKFFDYDVDGDQDFLFLFSGLLGANYYGPRGILYDNDGSGQFSLWEFDTYNPMIDLISNHLEISDANQDGIPDIFTCGFNQNSKPRTKLFNNVGQYVNTSEVSTLVPFNFKLSPNPVTDNCFVSIENLTSLSLSYVVFDVEGRKIIQETKIKNSSDHFEINMSSIITGVYYLQVLSNNYISTKKIVKL